MRSAWSTYAGGPQSLSLQEQVYGPDGQPRLQTKTLKVNIPPGVKDGQKIRLSGQGSPGAGGGEAGDLYLKIKLAPHPQFKVKDDNVILDLKLAPWEAALGASVRVPTLDGAVEMKIPPGIGSGAKLRVRGKGLGASGRRGDQMVRIMIQSPKDSPPKNARSGKSWPSRPPSSPGTDPNPCLEPMRDHHDAQSE
jgi:curved DNA-binding protein